MDVEITSGTGIPIKLLQFATPTLARLVSVGPCWIYFCGYILTIVDGRDTLCIWDLDGRPECVAKKQYQDMITFVIVPAFNRELTDILPVVA